MNDAQALAQSAASSVQAWVDKNHADGGVCDFCCHLIGDDPCATWITGSSVQSDLEFIDENLDVGSIGIVNDPYWAACRRCDAVVAERDPDRLVEHVLATRDVERTGAIPGEILAQIRQDLRQLYEVFFATEPRREASW